MFDTAAGAIMCVVPYNETRPPVALLWLWLCPQLLLGLWLCPLLLIQLWLYPLPLQRLWLCPPATSMTVAMPPATPTTLAVPPCHSYNCGCTLCHSYECGCSLLFLWLWLMVLHQRVAAYPQSHLWLRISEAPSHHSLYHSRLTHWHWKLNSRMLFIELQLSK